MIAVKINLAIAGLAGFVGVVASGGPPHSLYFAALVAFAMAGYSLAVEVERRWAGERPCDPEFDSPAEALRVLAGGKDRRGA